MDRVGPRLWITIVAAALALGAPASAQTRAKSPAPKAAPAAKRAVDLPVEPETTERRTTPATLRAAAESNDYASFEAIYRKAAKRGEQLGAFADLYEVWKYAESEAAGSFFGAEMYSKLSARYPDYPKFIREYQVVDRIGQVFYPTRETRTFLLAQAVADVDPIVAPAAKGTKAPTVPTKAAVHPAAGLTSAAPAKPAVASEKESVPEQKPVAKLATAPGIPAPTEAVVSAEKSAAPIASPTSTSVYAPPVVEPPPSADALKNDMSQSSTATAEPKKDFAAAEMMTGERARGILLIIIGLVGIGFLTLTMQASSSEAHTDEEADDEGKAKSHS